MGMFDFVTDPVASAAGAALSFVGGQKTNQANIDIANANNQWSAEQYATRYQTQVKDLEAAGLNPMLAYMQSPGSAPQAQPVTLTNPYHSAVQTYNEGMSTRGRYETDIAAAGHHGSSAELNRKQLEQIDATVGKIVEETRYIKKDTERVSFTIQKLAEEAANIAQDTQNKTVVRKQIAASIAKIDKETKLLSNQVAVEAALDNFGRSMKEVSPAMKLVLDLFRSIK